MEIASREKVHHEATYMTVALVPSVLHLCPSTITMRLPEGLGAVSSNLKDHMACKHLATWVHVQCQVSVVGLGGCLLRSPHSIDVSFCIVRLYRQKGCQQKASNTLGCSSEGLPIHYVQSDTVLACQANRLEWMLYVRLSEASCHTRTSPRWPPACNQSRFCLLHVLTLHLAASSACSKGAMCTWFDTALVCRTGMLQWGNVFLSLARKYLDEAAIKGNIPEVEEKVQAQFDKATAKYKDALGIKADFYDGEMQLGQVDFERAKLAAGFTPEPVRYLPCPSLPLPCLALPCLALPRLASPRLASPLSCHFQTCITLWDHCAP